MKSLITLCVSIGYLFLTSLTIPDEISSASVHYGYNPPLHRVLWRNCDLYYVDGGTYIGTIAPDTGFYLIGNHFFHSAEKRIHRLGVLDTAIRIIGAYSISISVNQERENARITNYEGTVMINTDNQSFGLERNETLIINKEGSFEKFANEFSSADSLWLTAGEIWLNNVDLPTLVNRMAINFGFKVKFNFQPGDERIVNAQDIHFDCKSGSLEDGLQLLQTTTTESQKFSYRVDNGVIFIEKYSS